MKSFTSLIIAISLLFVSLAAFAAEVATGPAEAAEKFFAGYVAVVVANKDTKAWVAKSKLASAAFKAAYDKAMSGEEVDADAVLQAQDVPSAPFKAGKPAINGDEAIVILTAKFGEDDHKVNVALVRVKGAWLLEAISSEE